MEIRDLVRGVIKQVVEARIRETDITDGSRVAVGSPEHVTDLEMRIADLERWRDRQRRGSAARDNYSRLISRLRGELRTANRVANPQAPALSLGMDEADDDKKKKKKLTHVIPPTDMCGEAAEKTKDKKRRVKCRGCGKTAYVSKAWTDSSEPYSCAKCDDKDIFRGNRKVESYPGAEPGSWVVKHKYDGFVVGFPTSDKAKAHAVADARNNVAVNGAWGKSNRGLEAPYEVVPHELEAVTESVDMEDPEYASIETFVQYILDDERDSYTHEDLTALNFRTRMPVAAIRKELEGYGITLANRPNEKKVRGFSSNSNDRWFGPGSMPTHGGAGIDPQTGRATSGRGDI